MTANSEIIKRILDKIENLPSEHLFSILSYVENLKDLNKEKLNILSFAGSWKDLDQDVFKDLTENLHQNRIDESKSE